VQKKTPLSYYGGKQRMLRHILPLIPAQRGLYCEPFCGGAAVFWALPPQGVEVLNDKNGELVNFWRVLAGRADALSEHILRTPHSRKVHEYAAFIYDNAPLFDEVNRAWATWLMCNLSYASKIKGGWAFGSKPNEQGTDTTTSRFARKREMFADPANQPESLTGFHADGPTLRDLQARLSGVQLECMDALDLIQARDSAHAFFYVDPPYFNSDCGHYKGYSEADFRALLETLSVLKGRFLLSCYDSDLMTDFASRNSWQVQRVEQNVSASKSKHGKRDKKKTECLVFNYVF
jgi:DNA adenine methylase